MKHPDESIVQPALPRIPNSGYLLGSFKKYLLWVQSPEILFNWSGESLCQCSENGHRDCEAPQLILVCPLCGDVLT